MSQKPKTGDVLPLWATATPYARGTTEQDLPTLTVFFPKGQATGASVVICPGGGYGALAPHEGAPVAEWLNAAGITAFVLRYRHSAGGYQHPVPFTDVSRAMRTVRANAEAWGLDANRIGILGFSAGGHLAATISTQFDEGDQAAPDAIDRVSSRPDVSILLYAVITFTDPYAHKGSRTNLLGPNPTPEAINAMSAETRVTPRTPPAFLFHTVEDKVVPIEDSLMYAAALRAAGIPFEMHIYEPGTHGVGLAPTHPVLNTWPGLCITWLRGKGF